MTTESADAAPPPLIAAEGATPPAEARTTWITTADGVRLRAAIWPRAAAEKVAPRGTVLIVGGRTEFIEKYYELIGEFRERGFAVASFDWRGQGLSQRLLADPLKGHVDDFDAYQADLDAMITAMSELDWRADMPKPWRAFAHSMGGCVLLERLRRGEHAFVGAVMSAPMVLPKLALLPAWVARRLCGLVCAVGGGTRRALGVEREPYYLHDFDGNVLTRDPARFARVQRLLRAEPKLGLGGPTWRWLRAALAADATLARPGAFRGLRVPALALVAGADRVVDSDATRRLAAQTEGLEAETIAGARHEIYLETDDARAEMWRAIDRFFA